MNFFGEIAQMYYEDPLKAILYAYFRNHSEKKMAKNKIDSFTKKGLKDSFKILNDYFKLGLEVEPILK
jgi:hypothetical protein